MTHLRRQFLQQALKLAIILAMTGSIRAQDGAGVILFKVITVKDEIVIGLSAAELDQLGGRDAGAISRALVAKGTLSVWQYAVRKASSGDLEQAPLRKIGIIAHESLRVEPYSTPLKILPHE
jgi:hypothetical protein